MLFVLDAGHGGKDSGACANGLMEKDITLKLTLKTGKYLRERYPCDVVYTRNKDVFVTLSERANIANKVQADFFCSFHVNSFNENSKGFESYRYPGTKGKTEELQKSVHDEIMKVLTPYNITDRGLKQQNFTVLQETKMPAILSETLFISNPNEAKLLRSEAFLDKVAAAHADGLVKAAGLKKKDKQYYLVTGAFQNKAEAEKNAEILKRDYGWMISVKES